MTRDELARSLVDKQRHISYKDMCVAVKCVIENMVIALNHNHRIEVRGFGSFAVRMRPSKLVRNPRTGDQVMSKPKRAVHFKPGKELKERVNNADKDV